MFEHKPELLFILCFENPLDSQGNVKGMTPE